MKKLGKRLLENAGGVVLERLQRSLGRKSPAGVESFGRRIGRLFYSVGKKRRNRAMDNLALAFPEMTVEERKVLTRRVFEHFGLVAADFLASKRRTLADLETTTEICGRENLDEAIAAGKGVLLVTGHFGNWERVSAWVSMAGYPLTVVIRDADQPGVNHVVNELRTASGTQVLPRGNAPRRILEKLRSNEIVGILSDQNSEDAFLPFFGKPAGTNLGLGVIQSRTGAVVQPVSCAYLGGCRYRIVFYPHMQPETGYETKGEGLLRAFNDWLERVIRERPEQWLWFHDRWRNAREKGML